MVTRSGRFTQPRRSIVLVLLSALLLIGAVMLSPFNGRASAARPEPTSLHGCTIHVLYPEYLNHAMHYKAWVKCTNKKQPADGIDVYIGMAYFKKGASKATRQSHRLHDCGGGGQKYYCSVTGTTPYYGAGHYAAIGEADLYFESRLTLRRDTTIG